jgi:hypothetical protein
MGARQGGVNKDADTELIAQQRRRGQNEDQKQGLHLTRSLSETAGKRQQNELTPRAWGLESNRSLGPRVNGVLGHLTITHKSSGGIRVAV